MLPTPDKTAAPGTPPTPTPPPGAPPNTAASPTKTEIGSQNQVHGTSGLPLDEKYQAEFDERIARETAASKCKGVHLAEGTVLKMADKEVTLVGDAYVTVDGGECPEMVLVGMCAASNNLEANRKNFKFRYDSLGTLLPLEEQYNDKGDREGFIEGLTDREAAIFGITREPREDEGVKAAYKPADKKPVEAKPAPATAPAPGKPATAPTTVAKP